MLEVRAEKIMESKYFDPPKPRLFAHRGLADPLGLDENTIGAFKSALASGATHLESDTQATKDGHAVLLHDEDLRRVAGIDAAIHELDLSEAQALKLRRGGTIPTLSEAFSQLPDARFNLDVKTKRAIEPTVRAIEEQQAHDRVLLSSFANPIRKETLRRLSRSVATSASQSVVIAAYLSHKLLFGAGLARILSSVNALQIPTAKGPIRFASKRFIENLHQHDTEVHFWTINDPADAARLLELGADGIVSDRVDLMNLNQA